MAKACSRLPMTGSERETDLKDAKTPAGWQYSDKNDWPKRAARFLSAKSKESSAFILAADKGGEHPSANTSKQAVRA